MKFPLVLLRRSRVQAIHDRGRALDRKNRELADENTSLQMVVKRREQQIELLKDKVSRVGISKLENEIAALKQIIENRRILDETLPDPKLSQSNGTRTPVLPDALVQDTAGKTPGDIGHAEGPHTGSLQKVLGLEVPGSHLA